MRFLEVDSHTASAGHSRPRSGPANGLAKAERVRLRRDFLDVARNAAYKSESRAFIVMVRPNRSAYRRLGVTVSKRTGRAVVRNRIKRLIRDYFRRNKNDWPASHDIIVIARRLAVGLDQKTVDKILGGMLPKNYG